MSDMVFDLKAASWRHDIQDELAFFEALAQRLDKSLPGLVTIVRERKLFSHEHPIIKLEVMMADRSYQVIREGHSLLAKRARIVRGIAISTTDMSFSDWLAELSVILAAYAKEHEQNRQSMEDFLL